jgi:hypothetical protein
MQHFNIKSCIFIFFQPENPWSLDRGMNSITFISSGKIFNADVNGALNIMRKSRVVDMNILYSRGEVDTPIRIRIA